MDTPSQDRVMKRERLMAILREQFHSLGIDYPSPPDISCSKRTFETYCYKARRSLRTLQAAKSLSTYLQDKSLTLDSETTAFEK